MPVALFEEWRTLYDLEPWAEERADYAAGTIAAIMNHESGVILDMARKYMPFLPKPKKKPQSEEEMKKTWEAICEAMVRYEQSNSEPTLH